jgi:FMN phosphatase YigB (HAD superfamily)
VTVVLFDFGGTLADEHWMRAAEPPFPGFGAAYHRERDVATKEWDCGRISTDELADRIAQHLGVDAAAVRAHIGVLCRQLVFFDSVMAYARRRRRASRPQALVTVNPDLFADIVEHYRLDDLFDAIVVSSTEQTDDKLVLCERALRRLDTSITDALLIDNLAANVAAFRDAGGQAYHFVDDTTFAADLQAGRLVD